MIDKNILPDYSVEEEKLRLHAALPLLAPAVATAIGAALGLTGTGLVLQKQIQNYFANNPGALDSIVSTFGTKPGDQPEVEKELKELTKPTTTPIKTWEKSFADTGTKVPEKLPEPKGIEVPPQEKVAPPGFQKAEPLGIDILTKDIPKPGIGHNQPPSSIEDQPPSSIEEKSLTTQDYLDDNILNDLLVIRGGIEGQNERMESGFAPMPQSTKAKIEIQLQKKIFDKYGLNQYPEGETPDTVSEKRKEQLIRKYNNNIEAIEYLAGAAYDAIPKKEGEKKVTNLEYGYPIFVTDDEGIPIAGGKIKLQTRFRGEYPGSGNITKKEALFIETLGSINKNATDLLFKEFKNIAKNNNLKYIIAEDIMSEEVIDAMKGRGFKSVSRKGFEMFKGRKIKRTTGRTKRQKNLVLDLGEIEKKAYGGLIDKPLTGGSRYI